MSNKIKVTIKCKQTMEFNQDIEMSIDDYKTIKNLDFDDVSRKNDYEQFSILEGYINFNDIFDSEEEFKSVKVSVMS